MRLVGWNILVLSLALLAAAAKKCPAPREYPNTRLISSRLKFNSGDKVYYRCAEDFTPSTGIPIVQCKDDGTWTRLSMKCEKKSCGNAGELRNGQFDYKGNSYGDKAFAICNEGYTLKGNSFITCKKWGWTTEVPTCVEGEATCSPPVVANSVSSDQSVSEYRVGDSVTFTCSQGFQLDGAQQITCGPGGKWQPQPPWCLPSPERPTPSPERPTPSPERPTPSPERPTPSPERPTLSPQRQPEKSTQLPKQTGGCSVPKTTRNSNADLADRYITKTSFASGDRVHYVCDVGYVPAGGSRYRTCNEGTWTPMHFRCQPKSCGSAGEIANGQFTYSGIEFGDTAEAICDEGYSLVGRATRICMNDGWDGRIPTCEPVVCEEPPEVPNAVMGGRQEPPYTYRSAVVYQCRVGTLQGAREIWCTKDGTWSSPPPTCKEMTCPPPNMYGAYWAGDHKRAYQYRDTILIECSRGFRRFGPRAVTCDSDGQWYPGLPRCRAVQQSYRTPYWRN
ncbi:complement component receptor 1-like protein isoform 2-T2 [Symphorus nematophorus]